MPQCIALHRAAVTQKMTNDDFTWHVLITPSVPDIDRYPSSEIHLPRKPGDMFDPSARYRLKTRSHSARMTRCWKIFQCHNSKIFDSQILQWITTRGETKTILSQNQISWEIRNQQLRVWSEWTVQDDWREGVRSLCSWTQIIWTFAGSFLSWWWPRPELRMSQLRRRTWLLDPVTGSAQTTHLQPSIWSWECWGRGGRDQCQECLILKGDIMLTNHLINVIISAPPTAVDCMLLRERNRRRLKISRQDLKRFVIVLRCRRSRRRSREEQRS